MTRLQNALEYILLKYFYIICVIIRPSACYPRALFQSGAKCKPTDLKIIFILMQIKPIFTSFALNLILKAKMAYFSAL